MFFLLFLSIGCSDSKPDTKYSESICVHSDQVLEQDGFDELGGSWIVGAVPINDTSNSKLVAVDENSRLKDLYHTVLLTIKSDGTYVLLRNIYGYSGRWKRHETKLNTFLFSVQSTFVYRITDGEFSKSNYDTDEKEQYMIELLDENTLAFDKYDSLFDKAYRGKDTLYFIKQGKNSNYIESNKYG